MKVTVSEKGQIVIPAKLRKKFGIQRGTKLEVGDKKDVIELKPLAANPILALRGKYKGKTSLTKALLEERARERERENAS